MSDLLPDNYQSILRESLHDLQPYLFAKDHPFLDRMSKPKANGKSHLVPVVTGPGGGASSNFSDVVANATNGGFTGVQFTLKPTVSYGNEVIDWSQRAFTVGSDASAIDVAVLATRNALIKTKDNIASNLLGVAPGQLGSIKSHTNPSGNLFILVLDVPSDSIKVDLDDVLVSAATASSSLDTGTAKVVGVNPIQGSIEVDGGGTWTPTSTHVFGRQGSLGSDVIPAPVFSWVPPLASRTNGVVGDTFLGVVRTAASQVIGTSGWAFATNGGPISNVVYTAAANMSNFSGGKPDTLYCNPIQLATLAIQFSTQVRYDMKSTMGVEAGFGGFDIVTAAGKVEVLAEPAMPANQMLLTKAESWFYATPQGQLTVPATNGQILINAYGSNGEGNVSRATLMSNAYFGCDNLWAAACITIN